MKMPHLFHKLTCSFFVFVFNSNLFGIERINITYPRETILFPPNISDQYITMKKFIASNSILLLYDWTDQSMGHCIQILIQHLKNRGGGGEMLGIKLSYIK